MRLKYLVALVAAIALLAYYKLSNPYRHFTTEAFWETATLESVQEVPEELLKPRNDRGSVLRWAAMGTSDPQILTALVERGAAVNDVDPIFRGTPLTGAAARSEHPQIIKELVRLGADLEAKVNFGNTALLVAAMFNKNPGITEELLEQGANIAYKNKLGQSAMDLARDNDNQAALAALQAWQQAHPQN